MGNNTLDSQGLLGNTKLRDAGVWLPRGLEFLSGLPTISRKRVVLMPMQAFVDESGGRGEGSWLVLIGVIAQAEDWAIFADRWRAELDREPALRSLHMRDAVHLEGEFLGWTKADRDARLLAFVNIVIDSKIRGIAAFADLAAHEELEGERWKNPGTKSAKGTPLRKVMADPYFLCFHSIIMATCIDLVEQGVTERFEIIFDEKRTIGDRVKAWYPLFRYMMTAKQQAIMPVEPVFRDDEQFVPLQVADLMAWQAGCAGA